MASVASVVPITTITTIMLITIACTTPCHAIGYSDQVEIGPNYYVIGSNININADLFPDADAVYNVNDTTNAVEVFSNALESINDAGGGVLYVLPGLYYINGQLFVGDKTHFMGAGMDQTIFRLTNYAISYVTYVNITRHSSAGFIRAHLINNIIVSDMTLDGNKQNQYTDANHRYGKYGLYVEGCKSVWFNNVKIMNFQAYGFDPHGWKSHGIWGRYLTITNCYSHDNEWDGFTLDQTYYIYVENCMSVHNGRHGFNIVTGSRYITLMNNTSIDNGYYDPHNGSGCGIMMQNNRQFGTSNVEIAYNYIVNSKKAGICVNDVHNIDINNNVVVDTCICFSLVYATSTFVNNNVCKTKILEVDSNSILVFNNTDPLYMNYPVVFLSNNSFNVTSCKSHVTGNSGNTYTIPLNGLIAEIVDPDTGYSNYIDIGPYYYAVRNNLLQTVNVSYAVYYNVTSGQDPTAVIQKAINDIEKKGGGVVHILSGLYIITKNIFLADKVHLRGTGVDVTVLRLQDNAQPFVSDKSPKPGLVRSEGINNTIISNMTINGNQQNQQNDFAHTYGRFGIYLEGTRHAWVDHVRLTNFQGHGMYVHGWTSNGPAGIYVSITNSIADNNGINGFLVDQTYKVTIINSTAYNNAFHGFNVQGYQYITLRFNLAYGNGFSGPNNGTGCGIIVQNNGNPTGNGPSVQINFNAAASNGKAGICLAGAKDVDINTNFITDQCSCFNFITSENVYVDFNVCRGSQIASLIETSILYNNTDDVNDNIFTLEPCKNVTSHKNGTSGQYIKNKYNAGTSLTYDITVLVVFVFIAWMYV